MRKGSSKGTHTSSPVDMLAFVNLNIQQRALEFYAITKPALFNEIPTSGTALNHPAFQSSCLEHGVSPHFVLKIKEENDNIKADTDFRNASLGMNTLMVQNEDQPFVKMKQFKKT